MAQIFLKPETNKDEFRLYFELFEKKIVGGATTQKYQKQTQKPWYLHYGHAPRHNEVYILSASGNFIMYPGIHFVLYILICHSFFSDQIAVYTV